MLFPSFRAPGSKFAVPLCSPFLLRGELLLQRAPKHSSRPLVTLTQERQGDISFQQSAVSFHQQHCFPWRPLRSLREIACPQRLPTSSTGLDATENLGRGKIFSSPLLRALRVLRGEMLPHTRQKHSFRLLALSKTRASRIR